MLNQVLFEIKKSKTPLSLAMLSQKLNIDHGALEGILAFWVHKGRLQIDSQSKNSESNNGKNCSGCCCQGAACQEAAHCAFMAKTPKVYYVRTHAKTPASSDDDSLDNVN